jgi:ATP-dependent helicase/nuclease subunit B
LARAQRWRVAIDAWAPSLSPCDGEIGPPSEWLADARASGYAATGLTTYAACPWRFFVTGVLGLDPPADAESCAAPTARDWGVLAHEAVARAVRAGAAGIDSIWRELCARQAQREGIGYPLLWELTVERIGRVVAEVVADDEAERAQSGFTPIETEVTLRGTLGGDRPISIQGRLDRIDQSEDGRLRVIDWKFRSTRARNRRDDPVAAALRARSLQPPLYAALVERFATARGANATGEPSAVVEYRVGLSEADAEIERAPYAPDPATAERILDTAHVLVDGIERGLFPMIPDTACAWCEVAASCRRRHAPSRARAERDPRASRVAAIRRTPLRAPKDAT